MFIKTAVVGCGAISQTHGKVLYSLRDIDIVAAADIIPERAERFCDEFGGKSYNNLNEMLDHEEIDVLRLIDIIGK